MENKTPHPAEMAQGAQMTDLARFAKEQLAALEKTYGVQFDRLSQIAAEPGGERVLALWKAGADLADAWAAVNLEKVLSKKQTALKLYSEVDNSVAGTTVTIPAETGVYRVRFSLDGFGTTSSDWDDVYFSFVVR